ncbi:response regulator [bacterium]|nr:response regulator [bacterium]
MVSPVRILLVEDEFLVAADITNKLSRLGYSSVDVADSAGLAFDAIRKRLPDLILMDIEIKGDKNGIETAKEIKEQWNIPIVFLTHLDNIETFNKAKESRPFAYLTKPVSNLNLTQAIELAMDYHNDMVGSIKKAEHLYDDCIFLKSKDTYEKVSIYDVTWIDADSSYCEVHTVHKTYSLSISMAKFMRQIESHSINHRLRQIHKSHIVNLDHITGLDGNRVMIGADKIDIGKTYIESVKSMFPTI